MYHHYVRLPDGSEHRKRDGKTVYQFVVAVRDDEKWGVYDWFKSRVTANDARNRASIMYDEAHVHDVVMEIGEKPAKPARAKRKAPTKGRSTAPRKAKPQKPAQAVEKVSIHDAPLNRMAFKAMAKRASNDENYAAAWRLEMAAASLAEPRYRDKHLAKARQYINRTADPATAKKAITLKTAIASYDTEGIFL